MSKSEIAKDKEKLANALARFDNGVQLEDVVDTSNTPLFKSNTFLLQVLVDIICKNLEPDFLKQRLFFKKVWKIFEDAKIVDPDIKMDAFNSVRCNTVLEFENCLRMAQLQIQGTSLLNNCLTDPILKSIGESSAICINKYWDEFTELEEIGKGGFGTVWKARHRIDGIIYAIKKIKFKYRNDSDYEKVIREVKSFATLSHLNVVGYNQAWFENVDSGSSSTEEESSNSPSKETSKMNTSNSGMSINLCDPIDKSKLSKRILYSENSDDFIVFKDSLSEGSFGDILQATKQTLNSSSKSNYFNVGRISETNSVCDTSRNRKRTRNSFSKSKLSSVSSASEFSSYSDISRRTGRQTLFHSSSKSNISSASNTFEINYSDSDSSSKKVYKTKDSKQSTSSIFKFQNMKVLLYIQMEYCDVVLRDWLDARAKGKPLPFQMPVPEIFRDILNGVAHIHSKSIIHRDLKPQNIFYSVANNTMKIGDFGLATLCSSSIEQAEEPSLIYSTGVGTLPYAAPEQRRKHKYDSKVDMYSLGIILIELLMDIQTQMELLDAIRNILHDRIPEQLTTHWPEYVNLVKNLTQEDPESRLSAKDALCQPPIFTSVEVEQRLQIKALKESLEEVKELLAKKELELIEKDQQIEEYKAKLAQFSLQEKNCN